MNTAQRFSQQKLIRLAPVIAIAAIVLNVLFYLLVTTISGQSLVLPPPMNSQLPLLPIIMASLIGIIGAMVVLLLINRFVNNAVRVYTIVAIIVLLLSLISPLTAPTDAFSRIMLAAMHVIAAIPAIWLPLSRAR